MKDEYRSSLVDTGADIDVLWNREKQPSSERQSQWGDGFYG